MKEEYNLLQTYEIFLKILYFKLLQEYLNNDKVEIILGFKIRGKEKEVTASLKKQAELEKKFGYDNILCYVTSGLNMYISDGVVTERFIDTKLEKIIENNLDAKND